MNRLGCDGWSTASAVPKEACIYPALAAVVKKKITSGAKALSHSYDLECTPEGVLHPIFEMVISAVPTGLGFFSSPTQRLSAGLNFSAPSGARVLRRSSGFCNCVRGLKDARQHDSRVCMLSLSLLGRRPEHHRQGHQRHHRQAVGRGRGHVALAVARDARSGQY